MVRLLTFAAALAMLGACASVHQVDSAQASVLTGSSSDRHVYFRPVVSGTAGGIVICPEPSPDTATERAITAAVKGAGGRLGADATAEASLDYSTSVIQLAGRTQTVVLARDLLFSACMMRANGYLTNGELVGVYGQTIQLIRDLGVSDKAQSAANAAREGVAVSTVNAALGYGNERDAMVNTVAAALLSKSPAERRSFVDTALACVAGADGAFCRASADGLISPTETVPMQAAVGSLPSDYIRALSAALTRGG
jgi:hypothetical protein